MAYHKLGKQREALQTLNEAKTLYEKYDNKKELAFVLVYLAGIDHEAGNLAKGIEAAKEGLTIAQNIGAKEEILKSHKELSLLHAASQILKKLFLNTIYTMPLRTHSLNKKNQNRFPNCRLATKPKRKRQK